MNNQEQKTHWRRLVNTKYLGAYSIPDGQDTVITIRSVELELVIGDAGKKEECIVAKIVNNKSFILNKTNCKTIEKLYGPNIQDWSNKQITVYETTARLGSEKVACLRIRPNRPNGAQGEPVQPIKHPIAHERYEAALVAIKAGKCPVSKVSDAYILTEQQLLELNEAANHATN